MNCVEWHSTFLIRHISVTHSGRQFSWKSKLRLQIHWKLDLNLAPQFILFFQLKRITAWWRLSPWYEWQPHPQRPPSMYSSRLLLSLCHLVSLSSVIFETVQRTFNGFAQHSSGSQAFDKNRNLKIGKDMSFQYRAGIYCNGKCLSRWSWTSRASWGRCCGGSGRRSRKIWSNSENFLV